MVMAGSNRARGRQVARTVGAAVWLHQGLWCKVLGRDPDHHRVVAGLPGTSERGARVLTASIGLGESALAAAVLIRGHRRWLAVLQTGLVCLFNLGGLLVGRRHIPHPSRLLVRNGLFVALIWSAVDVDG